jgi:DNA topoisomerase-1
MYSPRTKGKFVGCSGYPNCKNIYSLPRQGLIKPLDKPCPECNHPQVYVIRAGKRPWKLCINSKCKLKEAWVKKTEEQKAEHKSESLLEEPISLIKPKTKKVAKKITKKKPQAKK